MRIPSYHGGRPIGHVHFWERAAAHGITRGQFLSRSAGTLGSLAGLSLLATPAARAAAADPKPIPGGLDLAGLGFPVPPFPPVIHVLAPGVATPANSDPITITDFNGHVGYAIIDGAGTGTNTATGQTKRYTTNVDMRFMQGVYVGEDGRTRAGSFAFVWLDIFDAGPVGPVQIHDYNPGIASNGLFWTMPFPDDAVDVNPGRGRASLVAEELAMPDFGDFVNSIFPGISVPATVSFDVRWHGIESRYNAKEPAYDFGGEFVVTSASIEWSSRQAGFTFQSDPADTSVTLYALIGHERNGVYF